MIPDTIDKAPALEEYLERKVIEASGLETITSPGREIFMIPNGKKLFFLYQKPHQTVYTYGSKSSIEK